MTPHFWQEYSVKKKMHLTFKRHLLYVPQRTCIVCSELTFNARNYRLNPSWENELGKSILLAVHCDLGFMKFRARLESAV